MNAVRLLPPEPTDFHERIHGPATNEFAARPFILEWPDGYRMEAHVVCIGDINEPDFVEYDVTVQCEFKEETEIVTSEHCGHIMRGIAKRGAKTFKLVRHNIWRPAW